MDTFLTVFRDSLQVDISMHPAGLALCSMGSIPGGLFAAPSARLRLASLVNKHRPVYTSYRTEKRLLAGMQLSKRSRERSPGKSRCRIPSSFRGTVKAKSQHFKEGLMFANDDRHREKSCRGSGPIPSWAVGALPG